jgi:putative DNA primase/helicase
MNELERARSALAAIDSSCSRDEWVQIGMAAKAAGLSFDDFRAWSKNAANYLDEKDCRAAWKSFDKTGRVTEATLFFKAIEVGWKDFCDRDAGTIIGNKSTNRKRNDNAEVSDNAKGLEIWQRCLLADNNYPYILAKQGSSDGLRVYPEDALPLIISGQNVAGYLVVPCISNGKIQTLQFIPPKGGKKLNLKGGEFNDGYFVVGQINDTSKPNLYICEGIGQAWAIFRAANAPAVVCFGSGRIQRVASILRKQNPKAELIIVPDCGKERNAENAASSIGGHWVELPSAMTNNADVNDYALEHGYEKLTQLLKLKNTPPMRYKLLSSNDLLNAPLMRWMVYGVLPAEGLAALYGASGSGKSFLTLSMGATIATGDNYWFGHRITQAPVTYVCLEGDAGMSKRLKAWSLYFKRPLPDPLRFITQPFDFLSNDVQDLAKAVISAGGANGLVIIDTLNRAAPGADENSSIDMGKIIAAAKELQNLIGGLVLLVHHTGKDATKGLRGHSSLYASLDAAIEVVKTDTRREWGIAKSKDDATGNSHPFKLEVIQIGYDEEGEEMTSCVAEHDESKKALQKKKTSLGSNQAIAHQLIMNELHKSPHIDKDNVPTGKSCVTYDETVAIVAERMPTDAKHKKSSAKTAISGLVAKGLFGMTGDWLWCI